MIDPNAKLSVSRQALVLGISRGSIYYKPRPVSEADLKLMHRIDKLHMEFPFAGSRMLQGLLVQEGFKVGRLHVASLTQDREDLRLSVSACLHSESPHASCRENSTYAAPYFQGGLPTCRFDEENGPLSWFAGKPLPGNGCSAFDRCEVCKSLSPYTPQSTTISTRKDIATADQISSSTAPPLWLSGASWAWHKGRPHCPCRDRFAFV